MWYYVDMYNLPKPYLSYSAMNLWLTNKDRYRKQYYENLSSPSSPELRFGKRIADLLEHKDASMSHIEQYSVPEQPLNVTIDGVPVLGFIDSFDPVRQRFLEYKTGKQPWTQKRVDNHKQLDLYSLCIQELFNSVTDLCHLIWMQTENVEVKSVGLITHEDSHSIQLTGKVETFARVITQDERDAMRELLVTTAKEISDDYTEYLANRPRPSNIGLVAK